MNILIVDDEAIFRDYLKQALDWEAYGFRICGEARNGEDALRLAESTEPDLALVDINMPVMDGLKLTEELKARHPRMDVVIVTGHSEFDYARSAIRLGVEDYILKPFAKDELVLTLLKCRQKYRDTLHAQQTEQADRQLMIESLLNRLIAVDRAEPAERAADRLKQLGVQIGVRHRVACIEIDHMESRWNELAERRLWKFAVSNILQETMEEEGELLVFHDPEGRIVCLQQEFQDDVRPIASELEGYEKVCRHVRKFLRLTVTIGVGNRYEGDHGIIRSYEEARLALQAKFTLGEDRVITCVDAKETQGGNEFLSDSNEQLGHLLRIGDWKSLDRKLDELFTIIRERKISLELTYVACMGWVSVCLSHVTEAGHPIEDCFGEHFFPYSNVRRMETSEEVRSWMKSLFRQACDYISGHRMTRTSVIARNARQLIEEHYGDPELSVEGLAARCFINPSYLRAVFKKAYGMTAGEFIIHVRMTQAKALIGVGSMRLSDVAERVGFTDPAYFSKSFRKFFGMSPSEFENASSSSKS